jgi:hypothetical protein
VKYADPDLSVFCYAHDFNVDQGIKVILSVIDLWQSSYQAISFCVRFSKASLKNLRIPLSLSVQLQTVERQDKDKELKRLQSSRESTSSDYDSTYLPSDCNLQLFVSQPCTADKKLMMISPFQKVYPPTASIPYEEVTNHIS